MLCIGMSDNSFKKLSIEKISLATSKFLWIIKNWKIMQPRE